MCNNVNFHWTMQPREVKITNKSNIMTVFQGISRHVNIMDLNLTKSRSLIPDSLSWLLRWIVVKPEKEVEDELVNRV